MSYDKTLFSGTASYYSKYRINYPKKLYGEVFKHLKNKTPSLLDIGSGPATIPSIIGTRCSRVVCVEPDTEMIEEGKTIYSQQNINWIESTAEALDYGSVGTFDLVTFGSSLHWLNINFVLQNVTAILNNGGVVAILYTKSAGMNIWRPEPDNSWQHQVTKVVQKYLGKERRAGTNEFFRIKSKMSYEEGLLKAPGLNRFIQIDIPVVHKWSIDNLIGLLYSASFCRRNYFSTKSQIDAFEMELEAALKSHFGGSASWTETYDSVAYLGIKD